MAETGQPEMHAPQAVQSVWLSEGCAIPNIDGRNEMACGSQESWQLRHSTLFLARQLSPIDNVCSQGETSRVRNSFSGQACAQA
jgi:hypothetical protein